MKKKDYQLPTMIVIELQQTGKICTIPISGHNNAKESRGNSNGVWDEEW
jgi:hypothetical protein